MDREQLKDELRVFIATEILFRESFPYADDEALISGGVMDSFSLAQLAVFIEDKFSVTIPDTRLSADELDTINDMADMVMSLYG